MQQKNLSVLAFNFAAVILGMSFVILLWSKWFPVQFPVIAVEEIFLTYINPALFLSNIRMLQYAECRIREEIVFP